LRNKWEFSTAKYREHTIEMGPVSMETGKYRVAWGCGLALISVRDTAQCRGAERGEAWDEVRELIPNRRFFAPLIHANQAFIIGMLEDESALIYLT
jgi:hypothetical protein